MDAIVSQGARSEIVVENKIEGEGSVYTHVETEINGQKQVFETDKPGKYEIKMESSPEIIATSSAISHSPDLSPKLEISPSSYFTHLKRPPWFQKIQNYFVLFLSRWF